MKVGYQPLSKEQLHQIKEGDVIERMLAFKIPMHLIVQKVTEDIIDAGWTFSRHTGIEIDDDIPSPVSYIKRVLSEEEKQKLNEKKVS